MNGICIGNVVRAVGDLLTVTLPAARVGDGARVHTALGILRGRVVALDGGRATIAPFAGLQGVAVGDRVESSPDALTCVLGYGALGRAFDAVGVPLDRDEPVHGRRIRVAERGPIAQRTAVTEPLWTGVRALDGLLTLGRGARVGLFGAPGTGKTTLLESIARGAHSDAVVIALVGERGREAAGWLRHSNARTTIVCATADRPAAERARAAEVAMAQAVALREAGAHVLLIIDSLARYATALREMRAGLGESVGRGGYPPSVLAALAGYLEQGGVTSAGSMTIIATVLSDGADEREPLSDAARAALDGHIALSLDLARAGRFPSIDVLASTSRVMREVVSEEHREAADVVRAALALLADTRDLRSLGLADVRDPVLARALAVEPALNDFLVQRDATTHQEMLAQLSRIGAALRAL